MSKLHKDYLSIKNRYSKKYKGKELKEKIIRSLINKGYKFNDIVKEVI